MYENSNEVSTPESGESPGTKKGVHHVILGTLTEFGQNTLIPGICNTGRAPSRVRMLIWLIIYIVLVKF